MKAKRIAIGLGIAVTTILAVAVGVLGFNKGGKTEPQIFAQPHNQGSISSEFKPTTYYFDNGEVNIVDGSERLVYSYDVNQKASAPIAYEYIFNNTLDKEMAVNVKEVVADGALVSYRWSDVELEEITEATNYFITQPIASKSTKYLYVVMQPEAESVTTIVDAQVRWNYGEAGTLTKIHTAKGLPFTQTYIKNIAINKQDMLEPTIEEGCVFAGWYWDEYYTQPVTFPLQYTNRQIYARVGSPLPDDWFGRYSASGSYFGLHGVVTSGTPISTLKSTDVIIPEVQGGKKVEIISTSLSNATNVRIPSTVIGIGTLFNENTGIRKIFIPQSVTWMSSTFRSCSYLNEVVFEKGSQLETIGTTTFYSCNGITSVEIPNNVTQIGGSAFANCTGLTEINIPSGVTLIDSSAFENCTNLTNVNFDNCTNLTFIGSNTFKSCSKLTSITIPYGVTRIGDSAFSGCVNLKHIDLPSGLTQIGKSCFNDCSTLTKITIPASVETIGGRAFHSCDLLENVIFEDGCKLTKIQEYTFALCYELTEITIPENLVTIEGGAFWACRNITSLKFMPNCKLKTIEDYAFNVMGNTPAPTRNDINLSGDLVIPASLEYIGINAFTDDLTSITFEPGSQLKTIAYNAFKGCLITEIEIPEGVTSISNAFSECPLLKSVKLPSTLTGSVSFSRCYSLAEINIPEGVTQVGFGYCYNLKNVELPTTLTTIDSYAFTDTSITKIRIPAGVKTLNNFAFANFTNAEITFESGFKPKTIGQSAFNDCNGFVADDFGFLSEVETIGNYAFLNCMGLTGHLTLPATLTSISGNSFAGCKITGITVAEGNAKYDSRDNCNAVIETESNTLLMGCEYTAIPESVTSIGQDAFYNCTNLTSINIPEGITSIGDSAFYNCTNLTSINIPEGITSIGNSAFYNCDNLSNIIIPSSVTSIGSSAFRGAGITNIIIPATVTTMGSQAFYQCPNLTTVTFEDNSPITAIQTNTFRECPRLTTVNFGANSKITSIGTYAFYNSSQLSTIIIPEKVTNIGSSAFYGCSKLKTVYNLSALNITYGSTSNGYAGYYATNIFTSVDGDGNIEEPYSINYTEQNGGLIVTGYTGVPRNVVLDSRTIKIADNAFKDCLYLNSVTIPASVTSIGNSAFYNCGNLTTVTFEEGSQLDTIGSSAFNSCQRLVSINLEKCTHLTTIDRTSFYFCGALTSIAIPINVTTIGSQAFDGCGNLYIVYDLSTKLNISKGSSGNGYVGRFAKEILYSIDEPSSMIEIEGIRYFNDTTGLIVMQLVDTSIANVILDSRTTTINPKAFYECNNIVSVQIPSGVTNIGTYAFYNCTSLTQVNIPYGISEIKSYTFYNCIKLRDIEIPSSVTSIASSAFYNCGSLINPVIPEGVVSIKSLAFYNCSSISQINLPDSLQEIDTAAFYGTNLTSINLPKNLQRVGLGSNSVGGAMFGTKIQGKIVIPASVTRISYQAFYKCKLITEVVFERGSQLTGIGDYAFEGCTGITSITLPSSLKSLSRSAFSGCSNLSHIIFPKNSQLTSINYGVFSRCNLSNLVLPSSLKTIGDSAFSGACSGTLLIPATVTSIGKYAFSGCKFTQVFFEAGSQLKTIGNNAFERNSTLTSITIPKSVTSIGTSAFSDCPSLMHLSFDSNSNLKTIGKNAFAGTYNGSPIVGDLVIPANVTTIGPSAFSYAKITSLYIPASVTSIDESAFDKCSSLASIIVDPNNTTYDSRNNCNAIIKTATGTLIKGCNFTIIPSDITSIGAYAFNGCSKLTSITIPSGVTSIGQYAFSSCSGLTSVTFEEGSKLTSIGASAFNGCSKLTSVVIPSSVTSIGSNAFYSCNKLYTIYNFSSLDIVAGSGDNGGVAMYARAVYKEFPIQVGEFMYVEQDDDFILAEYLGSDTEPVIDSRVTQIGGSAFYQNKSVTRIIIPASVTSIGRYAFYECTNLTSVIFEEGSLLTTIDDYAFYKCTNLTSVTFEEGSLLTTIGQYAFYECTNLTNVTIESESKLTTIGQYAFYYCGRITNIIIPEGVTTIGTDAFGGCWTLYVVYNVSNLDIVVGSSSNGRVGQYAKLIYTSAPIEINGVLYIEQGGEFIASGYVGNGGDIVLDSRTTSIGMYAFYNKASITSITIPSGVTIIEDYAFHSCSNLTSVVIPSNVISIGVSAFSSCSKLKSVTFEEGSKLTSIGNSAFSSCSNLTSVVIPSSVTSIGNSAFGSCSNLTSVVIPSSVTSIGNSAFYSCYKLTSATFEVTEGWTAGTTALTSANLSNKSTAASYLKSTYYSKVWTRS